MSARVRMGALLMAAVLVAAGSLEGQDRWNLDLRAGAGLPVDDLGQAELDAGVGFEATVGVRLVRHLWAYGGWGWHHFTTDEVVWGGDADVEQTGYLLGLRFEHPFSGEDGDGPAFRVHAAGTLEHVEVEDDEGDLVTDSDHGPGFEVGVGVSVPAWGAWRLTPGIRYRALSRELLFGDLLPEVTLQYVALDVGISRSF